MRKVLVGLAAAFVMGCSSGGGGSAAQVASTPRIRGSADRILEVEINAGVYQNALEVIQNLRPNMMVARGTSTGPVPIIPYVDDVRMADLNALLTVPANRIREIRFINAKDATTRWGTGHASGAILVTTKK